MTFSSDLDARRVMPESNRGADDEEVENEQMEEYEAQKEVRGQL